MADTFVRGFYLIFFLILLRSLHKMTIHQNAIIKILETKHNICRK